MIHRTKKVDVENGVRSYRKFVVGGLISLLVFVSILYFNESEAIPDDYIIIWTRNYEGDIFGEKVIESGKNEGVSIGMEKIGFADGKGNYFLSDFSLSKSKTLIITPGVNIIFVEYGGFRIWGNLIINGTENNPIIFKSETGKEESQPYQSWGNIRIFEMNGTVEPIIKHCYIYHASIVSHRGLIIKNVTIDHSYGIRVYGNDKWKTSIIGCRISSYSDLKGHINGIYTIGCTDAIINENVINGNYSHLFISSNNIICQNNNISDNMGILIFSKNAENVIISKNTMIESSLSINGNVTIDSNYILNRKDDFALIIDINYNPKINNNSIIGNVSLFGEDQEKPLDIRYNYWGTIDSEIINSSFKKSILNIYIKNSPKYDYEPYLDEDMNIYVYRPGQVDDNVENEDKKPNTFLIILMTLSIISISILVVIILFIWISKKRRKQVK